MSEEDAAPWLTRYRSTVTEEPTPSLDEAILRAAGRRSMQIRTMRRGALALALAAAAIVPLWGARMIRVSRTPQVPQAQSQHSSDYGRQEGLTRYYLMNVAGYTGPGSVEQTQ